jgi:ADP-heptose:LPS heptosyltransferase
MFRKIYYGLRRFFLTLGAIILAPFIFMRIYRRGRRVDYSKPRILVIPHLTRIGDLVTATPVFRAIKEKYPNSYLAILVAGRVEPLIRNNQNINEVIVYRHFDLWGTIEKIRARKFDWSFSLSGTSISTVISFLGFIPNIAKITRRPRPFSEVLTDWLAMYQLHFPNHEYLPGYYLRLLEFIGIKNPREVKEVFATRSGEVKANDLFSHLRSRTDDLVVGMSISAGNKIKEWGDENFKNLADQIKQKYNAKILLIGAPREEERIIKISGENIFHVANFSLEELPSLIKRLNLFIAVDTGLIYIAHALKIPLIDIIGPVDPDEQPPRDEISIQVLPLPEIKPSSFVMKKPGSPEEHKKAIESIKVEDVMRAVEKLISKK